MGRNINNLQPDGHGWRARLGVLTHDDSAVSESELWTMAPDGVSLHTSRVFFADLLTFADPPGPRKRDSIACKIAAAGDHLCLDSGQLPSRHDGRARARESC
jgi:hypothetical protein